MHKTFEINQHVLIKNSANKILLLEQDGKWMLPGGRLEEGDSPESGLKRELAEETGLDNINIEGIYDIGISSSGNTFLVTYKSVIEGEPVIKISDEHNDYVWVDKDNIDNYELAHESNKDKILDYISNF